MEKGIKKNIDLKSSLPDHKEMQKKRIVLLWFIIGMYLLIRFFCTQWLESLWEYSTYLFELIVVICSYLLINEKFKLSIKNFPKVLRPVLI